MDVISQCILNAHDEASRCHFLYQQGKSLTGHHHVFTHCLTADGRDTTPTSGARPVLVYRTLLSVCVSQRWASFAAWAVAAAMSMTTTSQRASSLSDADRHVACLVPLQLCTIVCCHWCQSSNDVVATPWRHCLWCHIHYWLSDTHTQCCYLQCSSGKHCMPNYSYQT